MREIKFRAWDKRLKHFFYFTLKDLWKEGCETQLSELHDSKHQSLNTEYPYEYEEQFTGLHDKNGKEIYEGDIIEGLHDFGPGGWDKRRGKIEWKGDGYWMHYWKDYEVIGNIYENLLEA